MESSTATDTERSSQHLPPGEAGQLVARSPQAWWRAAAIAACAISLAVVILYAVWLLIQPIVLLLIAVVIAQVLTPIVAWFERWLPRGIAVVAVYAGLALILAGVLWLITMRLVGEGQTLVDESPALMDRSREWLDNIDPGSADRITTAAQSGITRFSDLLLSLPFTIFSSVLNVLLVIFMSIYWLIATPAIKRFALSLIPEVRRDRTNDVLDAMGQTMGGYVRATAINGVIIAAMTYTGLFVIGVPYTVSLAILAGFGEFLPVIGPIVAAVPAIAVALLDSPRQAIVVVIFYILLQQLEANLLVPFIMRAQADVPPLLSLFALLAGSTLGGIIGALIAIPLAGAFRVLVIRVVAPAEQQLVGSDGVSPPTRIGPLARLRAGRRRRAPS